MQKVIWFASGLLVGLTALSITKASVPTHGQITDDTAIYSRLSDIRVRKAGKIDFDASIRELNLKETQNEYREKLPLNESSRLKGPIERVSKQRYR